LSAVGHPHLDDHASLHWTAYYDDYCSTHRQSKNYNYYRCQSRCRCQVQICDCPLPHPDKLLEVTCEQRLNHIKAYVDWMSRTWRDRLLGAAAGAALTLATLWLILVSAATATVILRT